MGKGREAILRIERRMRFFLLPTKKTTACKNNGKSPNPTSTKYNIVIII
jgi:hypothetical protein